VARRCRFDPKRNDPKFVDRTRVLYAWMETVPARASSPGCSARMIKFASPPSEVMLEAPNVRRVPSFKGVMRLRCRLASLVLCEPWGRDHHGTTLPDRSVPHQRHQHACRGGRSSEHYGYCESAPIRPVAPPVGGLRWTRPAVMRSIRGGVEAGRQGHGCTSVVARLPTIRRGCA